MHPSLSAFPPTKPSIVNSALTVASLVPIHFPVADNTTQSIHSSTFVASPHTTTTRALTRLRAHNWHIPPRVPPTRPFQLPPPVPIHPPSTTPAAYKRRTPGSRLLKLNYDTKRRERQHRVKLHHRRPPSL
ncbi:hypothetical protein EYR40_009690 [Pleurotus pulmonarius]|nr:hypothetical protein EYR40_009690 [Pleurotus pulmonarius]